MKDSVETVWKALSQVMDPEIPVVSLVEMGILRDVAIQQDRVLITISPTFSGCPALDVMKRDIIQAVQYLGFDEVEVVVTLSPPWTTDWISEAGRSKLKVFGISPPSMHKGAIGQALLNPVECPYCFSIKTTLRNSFGPTPCRMIFTCNDCKQPFEQFKPL